MPKAPHSPAFRTDVISPLVRGEVLVPPLRTYLCDPDFGGLTIEIPPMGKRPYDGWFHPSEHPAWAVRALWVYLAAPHLLTPKIFDSSTILAMTAGTIWHSVLEHAMEQLGLVDATEVGWQDANTKARGKGDGIRKGEVIEIKTMKDMILRKIDSPATYIQRNPGYYLQAQEYMRMSGLPKERVLLFATTYPFEMREFVIEYDHGVAVGIRDRYSQALQAEADQQVPACGHCDERDECPIKNMCKMQDAAGIEQLVYGDR